MSTRWNSFRSEYPVVAIAFRNAPTMFTVPSARVEGPFMISANVPTWSMRWRSPRGRLRCQASAPQCAPRPGASVARANTDPTIAASAPHANAFTMSPLEPIDPSAIT